MIYFAKNIKFLRQKKGLSRTQLAKQLKVNQSTVARWENNSMGITIDNAYDVSVFFNISIDDMVKKIYQLKLMSIKMKTLKSIFNIF